MYSRSDYDEAMRLAEAGRNDSQISRQLGMSRATIRTWRLNGPPGRMRMGRAGPCDGVRCEPGSVEDRESYSHLLGLYLGDGTISRHPRHVYRLRVFLDEKYPRIIRDCSVSIDAVLGRDASGFRQCGGCVEVYAFSKHWPCLFPQHGPGRKHERDVSLTPWQQSIVDEHPVGFLRGLYESDGNRHINTVKRPVDGKIKRYGYSRYLFTNESTQIQQMFKDTCDALGLGWTQMNRKNVAVSRRPDVARLDDLLGPKR